MLKKTLSTAAAVMFLAVPAMASSLADASNRQSSAACLVSAAWNEARGRPTEEVIAVMHVVVNRSNHPAFERTICGVVLEKGQFQMKPEIRRAVVSAKRTGRVSLKLSRPADVLAFERMTALADIVLDGDSADPTNGATHFYTPQLRIKMGLPEAPDWAQKLPLTRTLGAFRFHRLKPRTA